MPTNPPKNPSIESLRFFPWSPRGHPKVLGDLDDGPKHGGFQHMRAHVDNIDDACAELARRGGDVIGKPFLIEPIGFRIAFFRDPWGNMIELAETVSGISA